MALTLASCTQSGAVECGDLLCSASSTCLSPERGCFPTEQVEACADRDDGSSCAVAEVAGTCRDGLCVTESCGDGVLDEATEQCDDGNVLDGDSCSSDCQTARCLVPVSHPTVAAIVADESCPTAHLSEGVYSESIVVTRDIDIRRVGSGTVTLDGGGLDRTLSVVPGVRARLIGFEISGGVSAGCGGGIFNEGDLILEDMRIASNEARSGGGICHTQGTLVSLGVEIEDNEALDADGTARGGGLFATALTLISGRTRFTNNVARGSNQRAAGGGIYVESTTAALSGDCELRGNQSVSAFGGKTYGLGAFGGAAYSAATALSISGCTFAGNAVVGEKSPSGGGGLMIHAGSTSITGGVRIEGNTAVGQVAAGGGLYLSETPTTATDLVVVGNSVSADVAVGGGIYMTAIGGDVSLIAARAVISGNTANAAIALAAGGGIHVDRASTITLTSVEVSDNAAEGSPGLGGGISASSETNGPVNMTVRRTTISGNRSTTSGGGLQLGGTRNTVGARLVNTTVSGNSSGSGAGLVLDSQTTDGSLRIFNATIVDNVATASGGGLRLLAGAGSVLTIVINNSIIARNGGASDSDCTSVGAFSPITGFNLVGDGGSCGFTVDANDTLDIDPVLGPLSDNGGPTLTHLPLDGSPALDGANPGGCNDPSSVLLDQRGMPRPNGICDVGAVEVQ